MQDSRGCSEWNLIASCSFYLTHLLAPARLTQRDLVTDDADLHRLNLLTESRHTSQETKNTDFLTKLHTVYKEYSTGWCYWWVLWQQYDTPNAATAAFSWRHQAEEMLPKRFRSNCSIWTQFTSQCRHQHLDLSRHYQQVVIAFSRDHTMAWTISSVLHYKRNIEVYLCPPSGATWKDSSTILGAIIVQQEINFTPISLTSSEIHFFLFILICLHATQVVAWN